MFLIINDKKYFSKYKPADKNFYRTMKKMTLLIKGYDPKFIAKSMLEFDEEWMINEKLNLAKELYNDYPNIKKECLRIIKECEYELLKYSKDEDIKNAFLELENIKE